MNAQEIQTIHDLLANRVVPQSAREGAAILGLAQKLVTHFAPQFAPPVAGTNSAHQVPHEAAPAIKRPMTFGYRDCVK